MKKKVEKNKWYKSHSHSNICKILHQPFDIMWYFLGIKMIPCMMVCYKSPCLSVILVSLLLNKNRINESKNYKSWVKLSMKLMIHM